MIPKIIHYCWFGGNPLPKLAQKCIASWKKYCPDYEIIEWNESNFDINYNDYTREAYEAKKWAFVSDVARLYALVNYGGIYMDTDVEVIKPLDDLLQYEAVSGFETETMMPTGLMACQKGHPMFQEFLRHYDGEHFVKTDGSLDTTTNVTRITSICLKYRLQQNNTLQTVNGFTLLPKDYLCPKDNKTGIIHVTKNTFVIHHFDGSWLSEEDRYIIKLHQKFNKIPAGNYIAEFIMITKYHGLKSALESFFDWVRRKVWPQKDDSND